jgi:hypothetical protein
VLLLQEAGDVVLHATDALANGLELRQGRWAYRRLP